MTNNFKVPDDFPMTVTDNGDGTFHLEWDENHPVASMMNDWTNDDFLEAIRIGLTEIQLEKDERGARTEFTAVEFTDNWDELFGRVENGETLTIVDSDGNRVFMMPYDQLPNING